MNKESAAAEIARIYRNHGGTGPMMITRLAEHTDMTPAEIAEGARHLARTAKGFNLFPESNGKALTDMDHVYAVRFGGQDKHVISWS